MKRIVAMSGLMAALALGCSAFMREDYRQFQALCEAEAGLHIYKTVQADEIFYEADNCGTTCAITLIDSQSLQRIGFCSTKYFGPFSERKEPGCYVFEKGAKGGSSCYKELDGAFSSHRNKEFFDRQCVMIFPMEKKFRYRSRSIRKVNIIDESIKSAIIGSYTEIYDSNDGSILLKLNHFNFVPENYSSERENYTRRCINAYSNPKGGVRSASLIDLVFN